LGLPQVIMLGAAGTIAAEIFVLTGHAAGMAGPAAILALLIGGVLSYAVAINYCELGTAFPEAGGAMSYVREAYGTGLLHYLTGSMDCLSSTFYAALSGVGFAYSLRVFLPGLPIVPTAIAIILVFTVLNILGVTKVGNAQIILGGLLLVGFGWYIIAGFASPHGFAWDVFIPEGRFFVFDGLWRNLAAMLATVALLYNAYVGFEVIVDDAEEIKNPDRAIPVGILTSLTLVTVIYMTVSLVTQGTVPWQELAGSETALTDAAARFAPGIGVAIMAVLGIIATITTINSAMLSATREAFTLGRDRVWPRAFSRLSRFRTPYVAVIVVGAVSALVALIGLVDLLSYISSSGYLFVLFWGSLSLIRLRKLHPDLKRPFKVPFYPWTVYAAGVACVLIIAFADWRAILFGAVLLVLLTLLRILGPKVSTWTASVLKSAEPARDRLLIAAAHPQTAQALVRLAAIFAEASEDTYACVLSVYKAPSSRRRGPQVVRQAKDQQKALLAEVSTYALQNNLAVYTKLRSARTIAEGILAELRNRNNVKLLLAGWPGPLKGEALAENPVKAVLQRAPTNVAVLLDRGLNDVRQILVPIGGSTHARLAVRLAYEIALAKGAQVTALRLVRPSARADQDELQEELEDKTALLTEVIEEVLGQVPPWVSLRVRESASLPEGILAEARSEPYDLVVLGASEEWSLSTRLFGSVDDWVAEQAPCSVLLCRRYEPVAVSWLRRQIKAIEDEEDYVVAEEAEGNGR